MASVMDEMLPSPVSAPGIVSPIMNSSLPSPTTLRPDNSSSTPLLPEPFTTPDPGHLVPSATLISGPHNPSQSLTSTANQTEERHSVAMRDGESDMELETTSSNSKIRDVKRKRGIADDVDVPLPEIMDHSGLYRPKSKKVRKQSRNGALLCLPLSLDEIKDKPPGTVANKLAQCLYEAKRDLVGEVIRVLGMERTLDIFGKTVAIQENGGRLTANGQTKRMPGGVFFALIKELCTQEEQKDIFQKDKQMKDKRKRMAKQRKKEKERMQEQKQTDRTPPSGSTITEWDCSLSTRPRISESLRKRLGTPVVTQTDKHVPKEKGEEINEGTKHLNDMKINHTVKILSDPLNSGLLKEEEKAAEDFEQIADLEYQLDFGID